MIRDIGRWRKWIEIEKVHMPALFTTPNAGNLQVWSASIPNVYKVIIKHHNILQISFLFFNIIINSLFSHSQTFYLSHDNCIKYIHKHYQRWKYLLGTNNKHKIDIILQIISYIIIHSFVRHGNRWSKIREYYSAWWWWWYCNCVCILLLTFYFLSQILI